MNSQVQVQVCELSMYSFDIVATPRYPALFPLAGASVTVRGGSEAAPGGVQESALSDPEGFVTLPLDDKPAHPYEIEIAYQGNVQMKAPLFVLPYTVTPSVFAIKIEEPV